ncbi:MAG: excisionase family DNA-binding protein [Mycobacterium sp.]
MTTNHTDYRQATAAGLLTIGQAAERLGLGVNDVRRWVRCEQCPVVRVGRKVRIPADWVAVELAATTAGGAQ